MKKETVKEAEAEKGTPSDVKGMPKDGRHDHMRGPKHEMGGYSTGTEHHDCSRK